VLLNPDKVDEALGIPLQSSREAKILRYFLCTSGKAAIFDLPVTPMSVSVHTSLAVLLDPHIMGVAFGISLKSGTYADI